MGTVSAKQLNTAMAKAKAVGMVEEGFTIGDCEVVLRNLRPDEYEAVVAETSELEDLTYLNAYQSAHGSGATQDAFVTKVEDKRRRGQVISQ